MFFLFLFCFSFIGDLTNKTDLSLITLKLHPLLLKSRVEPYGSYDSTIPDLTDDDPMILQFRT